MKVNIGACARISRYDAILVCFYKKKEKTVVQNCGTQEHTKINIEAEQGRMPQMQCVSIRKVRGKQDSF